MKKIGVLSVYNHNYGSILQAYALQKKINQLGYQCEIIKYKKTNYFKQAVRLFYFPLLRTTVKMKWKKFYCKFFQKEIYQKVLLSREDAFDNFIDQNMTFSEVYSGRKNLINATENYSGFILGSDQVWNPMNLGGDFYTMSFIPDNKMKIAYAPSFGVSEIPSGQKRKTRNYLSRINYISVRESDGVKIVNEMIGRKVPQVVDPTILIDRSVWDEIRGNEAIIKEKYIFCYFISANPEYRDFATRLSQKVKMKIVSIPHVDEYVKADVDFGDIVPENIGPAQFVNLISNAEYVCTDSFHGTVFSTLYEIPFFVFSRYSGEGKDSTNSRLYSFLKTIDMETRLYSGKSEVEDKDLALIDFYQSKINLEKLKKKSEDYLTTAIANIKE